MNSLIGLLLLCLTYPAPTYLRGVNGGVDCAACTIVVGIFSQVAEINNASIYHVALDFCEHLVESLIPCCKEGVKALQPVLKIIIKHRYITPDIICYGLNFCHQDVGQKMCHLFPPPLSSAKSDRNLIMRLMRPFHEKYFSASDPSNAFQICQLPGIRKICTFVRNNFYGMKPAIDLDDDGFSSSEFWRGSHWRGKDCSDFDSDVYPGRHPKNEDVYSDHDCNGIWGIDERSGLPWETKLCGTDKSRFSRGIIVLGDSVGAHFHFPQKNFLKNSSEPLFDEFDWPQYSFSTGYKNITETALIKGNVDSIYLRLRRRNLCNHRDFQNVCRNGANSFDLVKYVTNIVRYPHDKPAIVLVGAYGNDVCNSYSDTLSNMTSPEQFYNNMKKIIRSLDEWILPPGSHIVLVGLVDGGFIYDAIAERLHPIGNYAFSLVVEAQGCMISGEYKRDVKYKNVMEWFQCMQIGPCNGWMTSNKTIRAATSKRALELSSILKDLASSYKPQNAAVYYLQNPLTDVLKRWKKQGRHEWELIEPVDGFHPNQLAQPLITEAIWRYLKKFAPTSIGPVNPHNLEILSKFGDQGGH